MTMTSQAQRHEHFEGIVEEHRRLRELLELISTSLTRRERSVYRLASLLEDLEGHLRSHFEHEERGGYLEEALALAPHFANRAARLVGEHSQFLQMVREMHDATSDCGWEAVAGHFQDFTHRFVEHEADENRLVQDAMLRDIEAED